MEIVVKSFQKLSIDELYALLKLRTDVFVVEQNCPYPELDDKDQVAIHIIGYLESKIVAYARIFKPSDYFMEHAAIGRIVTDSSIRNQSLGKKIVAKSIEVCRNSFGKDIPIKISAQVYLNSFYESFGFQNEGNEFLEDGIPHIHMTL